MVIAQEIPSADVSPIVEAMQAFFIAIFGSNGFVDLFIQEILFHWIWDGIVVGIMQRNVLGSSPVTRMGWILFLICILTAGGVAFYGYRNNN